nr:zinc finger MYM-type protein 1-like [Malus domestica]
MEQYYKRKSSLISSDNYIPNSSPSNLDSFNPIQNSSPTSSPIPNSSDPIGGNSTRQQNELKVDLDNLERDPGKRIPMKDYPPNIRDESEEARMAYRTCLNASIDCTKFLFRQGLSFRGHDETDTSNNRGNYLELLQFLADHDEKIKGVVLDKAPGNLKLITPTIQKDHVHSCSIETINSIISDKKNAMFFSLLVDEARDVSIKEQMAVVLHYVDKNMKVIERFVGVQHVPDTTSNILQESIDAFINFNELSFSNLRGQGYDGASNMKCEFNGLKTKNLNEQPCAFYVHYFAHQLQLALVVIAKDNVDVNTFFLLANNVVNNIGASCKHRDALREMQQKELMKALENDSLMMGRGLNQETSLKCVGATRWNSHYGTLISLISMYSSVVNMLEMIVDDNTNDSVAGK